MNGFIKHNWDILVEVKKYEMEAEMLKVNKDEAKKEAVAAERRAKATTKRAEDVESAL